MNLPYGLRWDPGESWCIKVERSRGGIAGYQREFMFRKRTEEGSKLLFLEHLRIDIYFESIHCGARFPGRVKNQGRGFRRRNKDGAQGELF